MNIFFCFHNLVLVSTYVVCERLSVMHEPAGVVEILVQILQNTPILKYSFRIPPPPKMKIVRDLGTLTFQFQNTPPPLFSFRKLKFRQILALCDFSVSEYPPQKLKFVSRSWHFDFSVSEYPPPPKIEICQRSWHFDFSVSEYPPPPNWNLGRSWHFDFSVSEYPPPKIEI